jgi:hypothetical protein
MTWNPVRFVETLIHFRVAGPLKSVLDRLPLVSQSMPPSSLHTVLHPASPQETLLVCAPETELRDRMATAAIPLGYQVAAMAQSPTEEAPLDRPLVNVPVVVWSPDGSEDKTADLAALVSYLKQADTLTEATLVDLRHPTAALKDIWGALDDVVMGGVSSSQARWNDGLLFTGNVSTENSGGFASIRTRNVDPPINLAQWQGTVLQVQGDGQRYKWILRDSPGWDSLAYSRSFDTDAESPTTIRTGFRDMVATFRARSKPDAAPLNPSRICSMQLMLSKFEYDGDLNPTFQAGPFKLEVSRIGVFRHGPKPLVLLRNLAEPEIDEARNLLGQANLIGVVPQHNGFQVIGAGEQLPAWISQDTVKHLCQAVTTRG